MKIVIISYRRPAGKNGKLGPISVVLFHKAEKFSTFLSNISDFNEFSVKVCHVHAFFVKYFKWESKKNRSPELASFYVAPSIAIIFHQPSVLFFTLFSRGEAVFVTHLSGCHKKTTPLWFQLLLKVHAFDIVRFVSVQRFEVFLDSPSTNPNERVFT